MCLRESFVELQGAPRGGAGVWHRLHGSQRVVADGAEQCVRIREAGVGWRIGRVAINREAEVVGRPNQVFAGPLVPEVAPPQVGVVGRGIDSACRRDR